MYEGYDNCLKCGVELTKKNFGGGHKYGIDTNPDPKKNWMIIEGVCQKCSTFWEAIRADRKRTPENENIRKELLKI